ncbi:aldo-keto reductase (AKR13), putative [Talaromyces stipitatus ATCC 10500]|uniref:Aldo-keto reductase (AKR13), putative n=1 Tax=Talaromyces stipitatus (strain ATCC 10500 / CBS 375.48 / QM 6759 / NRRL 1006) TaxID=441959 RepID=B8MFX8_TALSN|nr:aldo-keto reductase (AKR13), putative [Talaromyces stipitatus ATCC 10500]EED15845.1 aldo-keto reductase (AKR13), putative [Talaromyces stipitatus ATCC 10500]
MPSKLHPLGKNGPLVPALGFGLMGMSQPHYGVLPSDEGRFALLDRAVEIGATFWDTADQYGDNEELLGKWFKQTGKRQEIFLATKFGYVQHSKAYETDSSAAYCKESCAKSLERLGVDTIDLYYLHSANFETPIEETMRALVELQAEGKIKHIGLSMISSTTLRRACKVAPVAAVQTEYSVFSREIEGTAGTDLLAACRELGVAVVVATPLGRGLITDAFSKGEAIADGPDIRPVAIPRFMAENAPTNTATVNQFKAFADKKGCTVAQLALAWLLKRGEDIFPIPGTKKIKYLEENWAAQDVSLSDEEEAEIDSFLESATIVGGTVPPQFASYIFKDTKE